MRTIARLLWRLSCARILASWPSWSWSQAWSYSGVLREFAEDKDYFDEGVPPPRVALYEDMQHWDG